SSARTGWRSRGRSTTCTRRRPPSFWSIGDHHRQDPARPCTSTSGPPLPVTRYRAGRPSTSTSWSSIVISSSRDDVAGGHAAQIGPTKNLGGEKMKLELGTSVRCTDGATRELVDVVIDSSSNRVTHLVIRPADDAEDARLVPVSLVKSAEKNGETEI